MVVARAKRRPPAYLQLASTGELESRAESATAALSKCRLCPWRCGVDRRVTHGRCRTGVRAVVASAGAHFGEEGPLSGFHGSGTIVFAWCNLFCQFCQNADISQLGSGHEVEPAILASLMLELQDQACHNINLVSPSHVIAPILQALVLASARGLELPIVYNSGGYDAADTLELLNGIVDIYMPDMKYADAAVAERLSGASDYPAINQAAVREMHRQVGDLELDDYGIARRGLLVRHLVLPNGLAGTAEIAGFLAREISPNTCINVMAQYRPCHRARELPEIDRAPTAAEFHEALAAVAAAGLHRLNEPRISRF
jgi:putative pyruvate formate lyase activating enzyme